MHGQMGSCLKCLFKEGQDVHAGDILARLDAHSYQAQYDQAVANKAQDEAQLEALRHDNYANNQVSKDLKTVREMVDAKRNAIHQFEAALKSDQATIESTKTMLDHTVITAPISGRIGMRQIDAGNMVHPGDKDGLFVITQMEPVSVIFSIAQQYLPDIAALQSAGKKLKVLAMDADNHKILDTGELALADNQVDQVAGTVRFDSGVPECQTVIMARCTYSCAHAAYYAP